MTTVVDRINLIWHWCRAAYIQFAGRRLSLPKNTDPTKTYQWRYLTALHNKLQQWEFDDNLCKSFIDITVQYAVEHRLLTKGLAIFLQTNLLDECYHRLRAQTAKANDIISIIRSTKDWLAAQTAGADPVTMLLASTGIGAYPNIVRWHQSGQLPEIFLALSRVCGIAISRLTRTRPTDRVLLPTDIRLFLTRTSILREPENKVEVRKLLRDDWRQSCPS